MTNKMIEAIDKVLKRFEEMPQEEFERKININIAFMTKKLLKSVLTEVKKNEVLDYEGILYFPEKYNITADDFLSVFHFIENKLAKEISQIQASIFPTYIVHFKYKRNMYEWSLTIGQGSACIIKYHKEDPQIREVGFAKFVDLGEITI